MRITVGKFKDDFTIHIIQNIILDERFAFNLNGQEEEPQAGSLNNAIRRVKN